MTLVQSTIDNNSHSGLSIQGGTLVVHSSTISANSVIGMIVAETTATISNSTFVGNGSNQLRIANWNYPDESFSTFLTGSLFQSASDCFIQESAGSIVVDSVGNTFSGDGCDDDTGLDDKNLTHASIAVSPLDFWGGLTPTHKLLPGSDGIDRVDVPLYVCDSLGVDQRDLPRPVSSDCSPMPYCDSGAVELQPEEQPPQDPPTGPIFSDGLES